jgi:hypothetical protein
MRDESREVDCRGETTRLMLLRCGGWRKGLDFFDLMLARRIVGVERDCFVGNGKCWLFFDVFWQREEVSRVHHPGCQPLPRSRDLSAVACWLDECVILWCKMW